MIRVVVRQHDMVEVIDASHSHEFLHHDRSIWFETKFPGIYQKS